MWVPRRCCTAARVSVLQATIPVCAEALYSACTEAVSLYSDSWSFQKACTGPQFPVCEYWVNLTAFKHSNALAGMQK